jgi:serine/threonine-protein kinase
MNHRIRKIDNVGTISTIAGMSTPGANNGLAIAQGKLNFPMGLAFTPGQGLLIADQSNHRIRLLQPGGGGL